MKPTHDLDRYAMSPRRRPFIFAIVLVASVAGGLGYVAWRAPAGTVADSPLAVAALTALPVASAGPSLLYRSTALGESYGHLGLMKLGASGGPRRVAPLQCDRVHFAAGHGICLQARRGALTSYHAQIFDRDFRILHSVELAGPPSRARMSPDGRLAAMTVFVSGHSYASPGFTTRSSVLDASSGQWRVEDLETFAVERAGAVFKAADFNFWGITFTRDARRFYATLGTDGKTYLVEGDLAARRMRVIADDVECPSLSPDNRRIAYKRRISTGALGRTVWQLQVLDLASGRQDALSAETRNVDDQVEWLDDDEIVYALPADTQQSSAATHIWALRVDGTAPPRLLAPRAFSPAVLRQDG